VADVGFGLKKCSHLSLKGKVGRGIGVERGIYHYMLESFRALYGKTVTMQWHFGNGADKPATSFYMSCEGLRQGATPATVYFNVLAARVYKKQLQILNRRGVLFAVEDDVKILDPRR
jgi:hypothetical protein